MRRRIKHEDVMDTLCLLFSGLLVFWFVSKDTENTLIAKFALFCFFTLLLYAIIESFVLALDKQCQNYNDSVAREKAIRIYEAEEEKRKEVNRKKLAQETFLDYTNSYLPDSSKFVLVDLDDDI